MDNGVTINNIKFEIFVTNFICEALVRAFLKSIKGHGGYYGYERCIKKCKWRKRRIIYLDYTSNLRTDESFTKRTQKKRHKEISPLVNIGIKMITMFPLDSMHLIYLGVMRKLLHKWTCGKLRTRLSATSINIINNLKKQHLHGHMILIESQEVYMSLICGKIQSTDNFSYI